MADPDDMFCSSCGERISRTARFCRYCGAPNEKRPQSDWGRSGPDERAPPERSTPTRRRDDYDSRGGRRRHGRPPRERDGQRERPPARDDYRRQGRERRGSQPAHDDRDSRSAPRRGGAHRRPDDRGGHAAPPVDDGNPWRRHFPDSIRMGQSVPRVVAGAIGIGLVGFLLLQIVGLFASIPVGLAGLSFAAATLIGTAIGQLVGFVGLALWYLRWRGLSWEGVKSYLGVRKPRLRDGAIIIGGTLTIFAGSLIVGLIATVLSELLEIGDPDEPVGADQEITDLLGGNPELIPIAMLMMFLVVGPAEEIMFRGVVQARMRERISAAPAIGLTSVAFAAIHIPGFVLTAGLFDIVTGVVVLTIGSIVFGFVYERTQNIVVVSLLHGFYNSIVLLFVYLGTVYDLEEMVISVALSVPI